MDMNTALQALIDGKTLERADSSCALSKEGALRVPANGYVAKLRIRGATFKIGDVDVPRPLDTVPRDTTEIFWPRIDAKATVISTFWYCLHPNSVNRQLLERGLLHLTREAAQIHADALIKLSQAGLHSA